VREKRRERQGERDKKRETRRERQEERDKERENETRRERMRQVEREKQGERERDTEREKERKRHRQREREIESIRWMDINRKGWGEGASVKCSDNLCIHFVSSLYQILYSTFCREKEYIIHCKSDRY